MKFQVLRGIHSEGKRIWKRGEIVDSQVNLVERFNQPRCEKFAQIHDDRPATPGHPIGEEQPPKDEKPTIVEEAKKAVEDEVIPETVENYTPEEIQGMKVSELEALADTFELDYSEVSKSPRYRKKALVELLTETLV